MFRVMAISCLAVALTASGTGSSRGSEIGIKVLKDVQERALRLQEKYEVDAGIKLTGIKCVPFSTGQMCVARYVHGIGFNSLISNNKVITLQLVVSRGSVKNPKDIGRAVNAFVLAVPGVSTQRDLDIIAMAGVMCVLKDKADKVASGPLTFEATGSGCVAGVDLD